MSGNYTIPPLDELMEVQAANAIFFCFIFIFGLPGNATILYAYHKIPGTVLSEKISKFLVILLAVTDIFISASTVTLFLNMKNNIILCWLDTALKTYTFGLSMNLFTCIALDRYIAVCWPLVKLTRLKVAIISSTITVTFIISSVIVFTHKIVGHNLCITPDLTLLKILTIATVTIYYLLMAVLLVILYSHVYRAIYIRQKNKVRTTSLEDSARITITPAKNTVTPKDRKSTTDSKIEEATHHYNDGHMKPPRTSGQHISHLVEKSTNSGESEMVNNPLSVAPSTSAVVSVTNAQQRTSTASTRKTSSQPLQLKLAIMFSLITVTFLLSWLPFWIANIDRLFNENTLAIPNSVCYLHYINAVSNPIYYGIFDMRVRKVLEEVKGKLSMYLYR